jgi:hypothetical protein
MQENNQLKEFQKAFVLIEHNVSEDDRKDAEHLGYSRWSISQYLNGKGLSLGTSEKLLKFFTSRIESRKELLVRSIAQ